VRLLGNAEVVVKAHAISALSGVLALVVLAYFALMAAKPGALARVLLRRGYEGRGWTEAKMAMRLRLIGVAGSGLALAVILLAIVKFVG
jgi:hypothetical protein